MLENITTSQLVSCMYLYSTVLHSTMSLHTTVYAVAACKKILGRREHSGVISSNIFSIGS